MIFNIPKPLDDELAIGLLGRFARLNGISTTNWAMDALVNSFQGPAKSPALWLVANACEIDTDCFTASHSMIPILYPISRYVGSPCEDRVKQRIAYMSGLSTLRETFRWCPDCVRQDQLERGFSYWRRQHQIGGMEWCNVHQALLYETPTDSTIYQPGLKSAAVNSIRPAIDISEEINNPALARLHKIQIAWLHQQRPLPLQAWSEVIRKKCHQLGLRIGEVGKRPVVSDLIHEIFPSSWLRRHMPEVATKQTGEYVRKVDGACVDRHVSYPSLACASILAALYESAEQALTELDQTRQRLALEVNSDIATNQAVAAFLSGAGLRDACKTYGANIKLVETRLREAYIHRGALETA